MMFLFLEDVKTLLGIKDNSKDQTIDALIPVGIGHLEKELGYEITEAMDEADDPILKFIVSKLIELYLKETGLDSKSVTRVSKSFTLEIPEYLLQMLAPYKNGVSNTKKVRFY